MSSSWMKTTVAAVLCLLAAHVAAAQQRPQFVGPNECINCHDHQDERQWYEHKEAPKVRELFPERGDKAGHINSLKQLDNPKGDPWAAAIGQKDKYDPKGACVRCHATVFAGDANAGVSCESCHGPASLYLKPHQVKDSYETSVSDYGMTRLIGNLKGWTQQCTNCHIQDDQRLIAAGHPPGDDFDLGKKFVPVSLHFKKKYADADVAEIAKGEMEGILKRRGRVTATTAITTAPAGSPVLTAEPTTAAPEPSPSAPPPEPSAGAAGTATPGTPTTPRPPRAPRAPRKRSLDPPAGSPTSIDPPPPIPDSGAPSASATPSAAAPAADAAAQQSSSSDWPLLIGGGVAIALLIGGAIVVFLRRKSV